MLESIIRQFSIPGVFKKAERFGSGLINDTYLCEFFHNNEHRKYILQKINANVFKHPEQVMENVEIVTRHILARLRTQGVQNPEAVAPALVYTGDGRSFVRDADGDYWRMFHFIESGVVFDTVRDANHAFEVGRGLGKFQALVADLSPEKLHDTLPGFHHTALYLGAFDDTLKRDAQGRGRTASAEIEFVQRRRFLAPLLTDLLAAGKVPVRVVHNDPKVNNVMVHAETGSALCMLDLDTVKSGTVLFDFGDCVRSVANVTGENAPDPAKVSLDKILFEAVTRGYIKEAGAFLTESELGHLALSVKVITYELGVRFLADYLDGDRYFKIRYPDHNLHRARVQFKLLESIEAEEAGMASYVAQCAANRRP